MLLVDDEADMHAALRLALTDIEVEGRPLQLIDAFSAAEAQQALLEHPDVALVFLDVVMETNDAGLLLVRHIRNELNNRMMRIVLVTGQPGYFVQRDVIIHYEIDDYRLKSELSAEKIFSCVYTALRTFQALLALDQKSLVEQLAIDLQQTNAQLQSEILEHKKARDLADQQMQDLLLLNEKLEKAKDQLLKSEKLASVGLLASGVAHEINNPIGFVNSNLGTLRRYFETLLKIIKAYELLDSTPDASRGEGFAQLAQLKSDCDFDFVKDDFRALIEESQQGVSRIKKIIQSLKDFSQAESTEMWTKENLESGIETSLSFVLNETHSEFEIRREYGEVPEVECLYSSLKLVFMNLLKNAIQATDQRGIVTIRTGMAGGEVWAEIIDTGHGISPDHLSHIFDPFFTTQPVGKGTGLGLAVSYGVVEKHHGRIEVDSEVGKGSRFRVCLPIHQPRDVLTPESGSRGIAT